MLRRIGTHVRNQWMGALALFVALGGTAVAATEAIDGPAPNRNSVGSLDIINGQVQNADIQDGSVASSEVKNNSLTDTDIAQNTLGFRETATSASDEIEAGSIDEWDVADDSLAGADLADGTVTTDDVADQSLTGADILPRSGVDSCISSVRLGSLCARAENSSRSWEGALAHCANLGLRVPTIGEALQLAKTYDIPNVDETEEFWTDEATYYTFHDDFEFLAFTVTDKGDRASTADGTSIDSRETVCVMTPTN